MKILQITGMNLNSLYGKWTIDLQHPEYESNGIFALTGPTGGGKTTILDAITLALFGQTVRLGKITKSSNEIMSRGTGECMAEIVFSCSKGTYRCTWYQHRARKKPDGNLAEAVHEISEYASGRVLETKKSKVKDVIIEKTGMDFTQFTRSMLLAQGAFDTFLKADSEEKSKILEQITGTEIYSTIGRRVFERKKQEEDRLQQLRGEASRYTLLPDEEVQQLRNRIAELNDTMQKQENARKQINTLLQWQNGITELYRELEGLQKEKVRLDEEQEAFSSERLRLTRARLAQQIQHLYTTSSSLHRQLKEVQEKHSETVRRVLSLEQTNETLSHALAEEQKRALRAAADLEKERKIVRDVYAFDQSISDTKPLLMQNRNTLRTMQLSLRTTCMKIKATVADRNTCLNRLSQAEEYLKDHVADGKLEQDMEEIRGRIRTLERLGKEESEFLTTSASITAKIDDLSREEQTLNETLAEIEAEIQDRNSGIKASQEALSALLGGRLLREVVKEKEHLLTTRAYQQRIVDLEAYRQQLTDGEACPLCGALTHPYASGNIPQISETDQKIKELETLIAQGEALQETIETQQNAIRELRETFAASSQRQAVVMNSLDSHRGHYLEVESKKQKNGEERISEQEALSLLVSPYGVLYESEDQLIASLELRFSQWKETSQELASRANDIARIDGEIAHLHERRDEKKKGNRDLARSIREQVSTVEALTHSRQTLYGTKDPDIELEILTNREKELRHTVEETTQALQNDKESLRATQTERDLLAQTIIDTTARHTEAHTAFTAALTQKGFIDTEDFLTASIPPEQLTALAEREQALLQARERNTAVREETEKKLNREQEKGLTSESAQELTDRMTALDEAAAQIKEEQITCHAALKSDTDARDGMKGKEREIRGQEHVLSRWSLLSELIGSADGRKFRTFAQGLTFEIMIGYANEQLMRMSDRYLLLRDEELPLEVNVMDAYQGSEVRSVKNVSGGESFIISLSLALGLSRMASRNVRVDSLFLDEGFGTLDEQSLETALQTLSTLPREGKVIGLISHVHGLKERIGTYITVSSLSGGKSQISGPGISYQ